MRALREIRLLGAMLVVLGAGLFLACVPPPDRGADKDGPRDAAAEGSDGSPAGSGPGGERVATAPANGWGDGDIAWRPLDDGLSEAAKTGMPVMLVVHTSWCHRCKSLKPRFAESELEELSDRFVMINVDQDEHPEVEQYGPDGNYIPRVVFLDSEGQVDATLKNPIRNRTHYFYMPQDDLIGTMRQALDRHGKKT